jgi:hypothetical protein
MSVRAVFRALEEGISLLVEDVKSSGCSNSSGRAKTFEALI